MENWIIAIIIIVSTIYIIFGIFASSFVMKKLNIPLSVNITLFFLFPPIWILLFFIALYIKDPKDADYVEGVVPGKKYSIAFKKTKANKPVKLKKRKK